MQTWTITLTDNNNEQNATDAMKDFANQEFTIADLLGSVSENTIVTIEATDDFDDTTTQSVSMTADEFAARFL